MYQWWLKAKESMSQGSVHWGHTYTSVSFISHCNYLVEIVNFATVLQLVISRVIGFRAPRVGSKMQYNFVSIQLSFPI